MTTLSAIPLSGRSLKEVIRISIFSYTCTKMHYNHSIACINSRAYKKFKRVYLNAETNNFENLIIGMYWQVRNMLIYKIQYYKYGEYF